METTPLIKAKLFSQYLGQMIEFDNGGSKGHPRKLVAVGGIDDKEYITTRLGEAGAKQYVGSYYLDRPDMQLMLKPLSSITDEDVIEVAKLGGFNILNAEYRVHRLDDKHVVVTEKGNDETCHNKFKLFFNWDAMLVDNNLPHDVSFEDTIGIYQYLQSKGYDAPQNLLNGKTLQEAGLAIYK